MKPPRFVVDWDDTLVEDQWPEQGPWLPGAVDALRVLDQLGDIVIFSCRVSPYKFPSQRYRWKDTLRPEMEVKMELSRMWNMLDGVGLGHAEIWERNYKPAATVYIDNRGVRFTGDWKETMDDVYDIIAPLTQIRDLPSATFFGNEPKDEDGYPEFSGMWKGPLDRHPNSARFHEVLEGLGELHDRKQADYGRDDDPFANVRASESWNMPAWVGAMVRATDKIRRLQTFAQKGSLENESVIDAFDDLAVYSIIARVLYEEEA